MKHAKSPPKRRMARRFVRPRERDWEFEVMNWLLAPPAPSKVGRAFQPAETPATPEGAPLA